MTYHFPIKDGDRVALAPHLDLWMAGARYGDARESMLNEEGQRRWLVAVQYPNGNRVLVWLDADDLLGAVRPTRKPDAVLREPVLGPLTCDVCGAVLVNEDCPNYGYGERHQ